MVNPITPTPIYDRGRLVGISDPIKKVSRLPTFTEQAIYSKHPSADFKYSSDLLQQSFRSEADLKRAEQEFKIEEGIKGLDLPEIEKQRETYDPRSGMYVSESPTGVGATAYMRHPTVQEMERLDEIKSPIARRIFGERKSENILTANLKDLSGQSKQFRVTTENILESDKRINEIVEKIEELEEGNVKEEKWVGSDSNYKKYEDLFDKYNEEKLKQEREIKRLESIGGKITEEGVIKEPTIGTGLFGLTRERPISTFDFKEKPITSTGKVISTTAGATWGVGTEKGLGALGVEEVRYIPPSYVGKQIKGVIDQPSSVFSLFKKKTQPDVIYDFVTGEARLPTEEDLSARPFIPRDTLTKEQIGKGVSTVTEIGVDIGKYFIPVAGTPVFIGEVGEQLKPYGFSPVKFAKEEPIEAGILGGVILTAGVLRTAKWLKSPIIKQEGDILRLTTKGRKLFGREPVTIKRQQIGENFLFKASETIGRDIRIVKDSKTGELVLFPEQTLAKMGQRGSFVTITSPKGKVVFSGKSPFTKLGKIEREKAIRFLTKRGITEKQAKELIRLKQPFQIEQQLRGGLRIKGKGARGQFEFFQRQPKEIVDIKKGIKTRGAKTRKDIIDVEREIKLLDDKEVVLELKTGVETRLKGDKLWRIEGGEAFGSVLRGKTFDTKEMWFPTKKGDFLKWEKLPTQTIKGLSAERKVIDIRFGKKPLPIKDEIVVEPSKTLLFKQEIDLSKGIGQRLGRGIKKTPLSKTFQEQVQVSKQVLKSPVKLPKTKEPKPIPEIVQDITPVKQESAWAGTGLYERTSIGGVLALGFPQRTDQAIRPVATQFPLQESKLDTKQSMKVFQATKVTPKISSKLFQKLKLTPKELTKLKGRQILKESLVTRQAPRQVLRQSLKTKSKETPKQKPPKTPKIRIKIPLTSDFKEKETDFGLDEDKFKVFVRKKEEDIELGEFGTLSEAKRILRGELKKTLRASGFIEQAGKKVKLDLMKFGTGFRRGKTDPFRIVQKKRRRLGGIGEVKEIQMFRKSSGRSF